MSLKKLAALMLLPLVIAGCSGMKIDDFAETEPQLVLEDYFLGYTRAWGTFADRFGNLKRQFTVDINGTWDGKALTLVEDFVYDDGAIEQRIWVIEKGEDGRYTGRAGDVVGAAEGQVRGNALNWAYALDLKVGERTIRVNFDDWMFLQPDSVLMNTAEVSKWGFTVGEVTLFFVKDATAKAVIEKASAASAAMKQQSGDEAILQAAQ